MHQAASNAERMQIKSPITRRRRDQDDVEGQQHGGVPGRGRSPHRPAGRRRRQSRGDARTRAGQSGRHERVEDRPAGAGRARRVSRAVVHRRGRSDFSDRAAVVAVAEGAELHRADLGRGRAPEPDARPDGVARRRAVAHARRARHSARRGGFDGAQAYVKVQRGSALRAAGRRASAPGTRTRSWSRRPGQEGARRGAQRRRGQ